jgi:hypothetical protein
MENPIDMENPTHFDTLERRCPRLGSVVHFGYCRTCGSEQAPCFKALDCWWESFDAAAFFRQTLDPEAFEQLVAAPPPNKIASILDILHQTRERLKT